MRITRQQHIAWAAGFFDGEGCVQIKTYRKTGSFKLRLEVGQKVREPLDRLVSLFGGSILFQSRGIYVWNLECAKAGKALEAMLPYLTVKKEQAECGIEFQRQRLVSRYPAKIAEQKENDEALSLLMRDLKITVS